MYSMMSNFKEYMIIGRMPAIVNKFVNQNYTFPYFLTFLLKGYLEEK